MDTFSGQTIKGYELHERIGAGGFGAVYRASQSTLGREVAVKIILPGFANQPDFVRRFEIEAQLVARLEHLHVVPLYDYWRDTGGAYLVMRWLRGGSLRDALERSGAYSLAGAALLLDQVASGLAIAHRHGLIHRDLKPGNILLDEDGNAYLADFGIAKDLTGAPDTITAADAILGSPDYLAPEQARGEPVTPQTDLYSLGVVLYELLTGHHPFPRLSSVETLFKHLNDPLPPIDDLPTEMRDAVNAVIQKASAKNPQHRYDSAQALADAFRQAVALGKGKTDNVVEVLTAREQEILRAIIEGQSNKQIAAQQFVTVATVKWYITQIYRKLGVRSRIQAIVRARELNLIAGQFVPAGTATSAEILVPTNDFRPENPYKGLRPFESSDHQEFFGREALVSRLIKRLGETDGRFLTVVGPSGSGKSSVVKAGLIPALWRGDLPDSGKWFVVEMLPGARPLDELEVALTRLATTPAADLREQLSRDAFGLLRAANLVLPNDGSEVVLVIDQFEEVFTLIADEAARAHFLRLLSTAVVEARSRVRVVITLRADFYDRPLRYADFGDLVRSRMETVLPLSARELERAIVAPAEHVGMIFESGLTETIIEDILYQPGALPLLQYALTELFEARQGRLLTTEAYQKIGGAVGALARRAEDIYREFPPESQEAAHQMFLRLVTVGDGAEGTRRRTPRSELLTLAADTETMDDVIDTYADYRLLSLDHDPATRSPTVELAHEAILHEWERLRTWLEEGRDEIRIQRQLAQAVQEWKYGGRDASFLLRGARLAVFEAWASRAALALTPDEREFLAACLANREREARVEQERQAHEQRLERRSQTFLRSLVVVLLLAMLGAFALTGVAVNQRNLAQRSAAVSQSLALASAAQAALGEGSVDQAIALSIAANQIESPPAFAQRLLYQSALSPGTIRRVPCASQWCWTFAISRDEQQMLTTSDTFGIVLSSLPSGQTIRTFDGGHTDTVGAVAFLPDGQRFLSSGFDDQMILWDLHSGRILRRYHSPYGDFNQMAVSPDGRLVATTTEHGIPLLWDIDTGAILHELIGHDPSVQTQGVAFSSDGQTVLTGSEDTSMILWDVKTGRLLRRFQGHTNIVFSVHFSPDGRSALSTSFDQTLVLWDVATGQPIRRFVGHNDFVFNARFSADGTRILSASRDGTLILWDTATGKPLHSYKGEAGMALNVEFLNHDTEAISSHNTGALRLWQLQPEEVVRQFEEPSAPADNAAPDDTVNADGDELAVSADGQWVAARGTGADANQIRLWNAQSGALVHRLVGHQSGVTSLVFSPDQHLLASASWDNTIIFWSIDTGQQIRRFEGHHRAVFAVAFSPDGSRLLSGSEDRTMILWDVEGGKPIRTWGAFADAVNTVAFSPDGRMLLAGLGTIRSVGGGTNTDNSLHLFNADTGSEMRRFEGHSAPVTSAIFSPDGRLMLSGSTDATVRLWDVATGKELRRFLGHTTAVWSVDFSHDQHYGISGAQDGVVMVWDLSTGEALRSLEVPGTMMTGTRFSPDEQEAFTASADGVVRVWQLALGLPDLLAWTRAQRYVRDLACSERELYQVLPLCDS